MKQKNIPEDTKEMIQQMKSEYDNIINEQAKSFLKEKHEIEKSYMNEINRLRSLIETHRESLLFEKLPILTIEQYNELSTAPHSNISLEQFIARQLYELKRDEKIKIQNVSDLYAELVLEHDTIKKELEPTKQKLQAESALRVTLESQISKLSVPIELPKILDSNDDIYKKYQDLQNQIKDMTSSYNGAIARSDLLLERLNANNKQLEANNLKFRDAQKEIASLKSQLSVTY
ncbi:hypothetical protein TVAG_304880 [Trichomonas vaginalis G3]|uniref:Uncharacterized protein n=1 Tax=Trichomonas vaginalis (strain ATCC PRA-98 / G3) TaxID=412133 RepID=A2GGY4_TRIV3|nr:hypothetical protein TVAG_304880 [Trichomonas vaginalis G3]|eukprot:XP_001296510.1 hypothetical protein [Trichomonas vaginalis G3]